MRTTIDIDAPLLLELKRLAKKEGRSLGRVMSDMLSEALGRAASRKKAAPPFRWMSGPVSAPFDYADSEALWSAVDGPGRLAVHEKKRK